MTGMRNIPLFRKTDMGELALSDTFLEGFYTLCIWPVCDLCWKRHDSSGLHNVHSRRHTRGRRVREQLGKYHPGPFLSEFFSSGS